MSFLRAHLTLSSNATMQNALIVGMLSLGGNITLTELVGRGTALATQWGRRRHPPGWTVRAGGTYG